MDPKIKFLLFQAVRTSHGYSQSYRYSSVQLGGSDSAGFQFLLENPLERVQHKPLVELDTRLGTGLRCKRTTILSVCSLLCVLLAVNASCCCGFTREGLQER